MIACLNSSHGRLTARNYRRPSSTERYWELYVPHLIADAKWALTRAYLMFSKHVTLPFKELPSSTPTRFPRVRVRRGELVPMRDGVRLCTDVYLPADSGGASVDGARPTMLIRMPYGIREAYAYMPAVGRFWARRGYAAVIQDVRGKFGSEGVWQPFVHEADDGYDTIDWVAAQPWCDGRVGMTGESYFAFTQWAAASTRHPALVSIAPGDMGVDQYTLLYEGGALCLNSTALWSCDQAGHGYLNWFRFDTRHLPLADMAAAGGLPDEMFRQVAENPVRTAIWDDHDHRHLLHEVEIPVLVWSGWYDNLLPGTLQAWRELEEHRPDLCERRRLILGPTDHETRSDFDGKVGRVPVPAGARSWDHVLEFTDAVLAQGEAGGLGGPRVRAHVTGADQWHQSTDWPPAGAAVHHLHLAPGGRLTTTAPEAGAASAGFDYDPDNPVDFWEGKDLWAMSTALTDRRPVQARPDVLTYTSDMLTSDVDVLGPVTAHIAASTIAADADITVALVDIWPDGYAQLVAEGIRRLSHRDPAKAMQPTEPGTLYTADVDLTATGYRFAIGHRIGVEVSGSNFDRWDRNTHRGRTTLHHDHGSHIRLPVISGAL